MDELRLIFKALGTPTEQSWPGVVEFSEWSKHTFNHYDGIKLEQLVPGLDKVGYDLLDVRFPSPVCAIFFPDTCGVENDPVRSCEAPHSCPSIEASLLRAIPKGARGERREGWNDEHPSEGLQPQALVLHLFILTSFCIVYL